MEGLKQQNSRINAVQALLALVNAVLLIGGVMLGIIEKVCQSIPVISPYTTSIEFSLLIVILLVRSIGILGKKRREKV